MPEEMSNMTSGGRGTCVIGTCRGLLMTGTDVVVCLVQVQENCIDLVGRIADRGAEYVPAREWMRICFELLEMLKAHKKGIRRATVNTFGYIAKAIGPQVAFKLASLCRSSPTRRLLLACVCFWHIMAGATCIVRVGLGRSSQCSELLPRCL